MAHTADPAERLARLIFLTDAPALAFSKIESVGDGIVLHGPLRWEQSVTIALVREQLPRHRRTVAATGLKLACEGREPIPDLIVVPEQLAQGAKPWAHETELLVEVVSQRNWREDYEGKRRRYAMSGAPQYLLVDPRDGLCVLYTEPIKSEGTYKEVVTSAFGEPVRGLLCLDGADLDTSEFLRYT